jgi:hypothetical protein
VRALAGIVVALAVAAPASADTVARRTPAVGPVLAGDVVLWGEEARTGAARVMSGAPGRRATLVYRIAPSTARRTERGFMGYPATFAGSSAAFAAFTHTSTVTASGSDYVSTASTTAVVGGPLRGPPRVLAGCIPPRGDLGCGGSCDDEPSGVAADGDRIAVAESRGPCDRPEEGRAWITVHGPAGTTTVPVGSGVPGEYVRDLRLAGRYLAWIHWGEVDEVVVFDLAAGAAVVRVTARDLGAVHIEQLDLQPDGTVAFVYGGRRAHRGIRLGWTAPGRPGIRVLDRHAGYRDIAIAGGRAVYERVLSDRHFTGELVLRALDGGPAKRLAYFPERRRRVANLDFDGRRATWAEQPTRRGYDAPARGPARIVVRTL